MAKIPSHTMVQPKSTGVDVPAGAFGATIKGAVDIMSAIGGSADAFIQIGREAQEIHNDRSVREHARGMRELHAQFLQDMQTGDGVNGRPDPSEYASIWQGRLADFQRGIGGKGVPPVVTEAVTRQFEEFAGKSTLSISGLAFKENRKLAVATLEEENRTLMSDGDFQGVRDNIDAAEAKGTIDGTTALQWKRGTRQEEVDFNLTIDRGTDPWGLVDQLKRGKDGDYPSLRDDERIVEIKRAETAGYAMERDDISAINMMLDQTPSKIKSVEDLQAQIDMSNAISQESADKMISDYKSSKPLTKKERVFLRDRINDDYDEFIAGTIDFDEYENRYAETGAAIAPYRKRDGAGEFSTLYWNTNPSMAKNRKEAGGVDGMAELRKQHAARMKKPSEVAYRGVRDRVEGATALDKVDMKFQTTASGKRAEALWDAERKNLNTVLRYNLEEEIDKWMASLAEPPGAQEIVDKVDSLYRQTVLKTTQEIAPPPSQDSANKQLLDRMESEAGLPAGEGGSADTLLPPLHMDNNGDFTVH